MLNTLKNPTFRHQFAAQIVALVGTGLATVALGLLAWQLAGDDAGAVLGTALGSAHLVVFPMCAMPLVLLAASRMVSFVKNYFLEYDGHDDEPKPYLGFFFQSTGMGLILSLVTYLCAQLVRTAAFPDAPMFEEQLFTGCFNIAAIICLVGNMSAVIT